MSDCLCCLCSVFMLHVLRVCVCVCACMYNVYVLYWFVNDAELVSSKLLVQCM